MHRALILLSAFFALQFAASSATRVDMWVNFEAGSSGSDLTASVLSNCTYGTGGSWTVSRSTADEFAITNIEKAVPYPLVVAGTLRRDTNGTRCFSQNIDNDENYFRLAFDSNRDNVTVGFFLKTEVIGESFAQLDICQIEGSGGDFAVLQIRDNPSPYFNAHSTAGISSDHVPFSTNFWYWVNLRFGRNVAAWVGIYDATNFSLIGTSSITLGNQAASAIMFGRSDAHTDGPAGRHNYWDDIVIDWTTAAQPLLPSTNYFYVRTDGSDSNNGQTNSASGAWATIGKAKANVWPGDVVRIQAGNYTEQVTLTNDGTAGAPITFLADGDVQIRGNIGLSGADYNQLVGLAVTHSNNPGGFWIEAIALTNSANCKIIDCEVHEVDKEGITYRGSHNLVIRGTEVWKTGQTNYPWTAGSGRAGLWGGTTFQTNITVEYCWLRENDDHINQNAIARDIVIRNNRFGPINPASGAHNDNFQFNAAVTNFLFESNFDETNSCTDHHLTWVENANRRLIWRGNIHTGNNGVGIYDSSALFIYQNSFFTNRSYGGTVSYSVDFQRNSTLGRVFNNIFVYSAATRPINEAAGTDAVQEYNLAVLSGTLSEGSANVTSDPLFTAPASYDLSLQSGSPARNANGAVGIASGAGSSSTSLTCTNAEAFWPGDMITVGGTTNTVSAASGSTITLVTAQSWSDGAAIRWRGFTDIGALPYRSGGFTPSLYVTNDGAGTYTVYSQDSTLIRQVVPYVDGVPQAPVTTLPATFSSPGTITVIGYPIYPTTNTQFAAAAPSDPVAPPTSAPRIRGFRMKP